MPRIPESKSMKAASPETTATMLNAIRNDTPQLASVTSPVVASDIETLRAFGTEVMRFTATKNAFLENLVNRIGLVLVTSKSYQNPWKIFKRGMLQLGETVEEIFVNIASPYAYDIGKSEAEFAKRVIPDVQARFHTLNSQIFYKQTVQEYELRQAFVTWEGVSDLVTRIVENMYTSLEKDEFQAMKYMVGRAYVDGKLTAIQVNSGDTEADMKNNARVIRKSVNDMTFPSTLYNAAGVNTQSEKDELYFIMNTDFEAKYSVDILAYAFNNDRVAYQTHTILVDSFANLDDDRLAVIFSEEPSYRALTEEEKKQLDTVPGVVVSKDWWMIFDTLLQAEEFKNPQGLYWNYFLHSWRIFSTSDFAQGICYVLGKPSVTNVTVSPSIATVVAGSILPMTATVDVENFAPQSVTWSASGLEGASIDSATGRLTLDGEHTGTVIVTATSTYDMNKKGTATITVEGDTVQ